MHISEARSHGPYFVQLSGRMIGKQYMVITRELQALAGVAAKTASLASLGSSMVSPCFRPSLLQAREYVAMEDPTQQPLQYVLESSAAARRSAHKLPYLPTGNLVSGLPAAFMSCCQASLRSSVTAKAPAGSLTFLSPSNHKNTSQD